MNTINVAVLGATGTVGQKFISLLAHHPYFRIAEVVASERSAGKRYREATQWKQDQAIPEAVADLIVRSTREPLQSPVCFSGLDASVAGEVETRYAEEGHFIISNAKNHRMDPSVPIIIPEVNVDHFAVLNKQPWKGGIVTNSNCSTMFLAMALAPLHRAFGIERVHVTTMQAISGAGYPGVASMDILGNVIPYIGGEEEKMECEPQKILGRVEGDRIVSADFAISAHCNRVPVFDGHTESVTLKFKQTPTVEEVKAALASFSGFPQEHRLPSAPEHPILLFEEADRPQPARDVWKNNGMSCCVGRVRKDTIDDIRLTVMGHNTVRGAAGAAVLNAEALVELGYLDAAKRKA